jgi:hypothetical protein
MTKRKLFLPAIVVVVLAAAGITAVVLSTGGGEPASKPCDIPGSVREQPVPAKDAPGGGGPLGLPADATTVRVEGGSAVTTEGPNLGVRNAVGGFAVVEAEDLDAAIALAARVPQARMGGAVEIRPSVKYW